MFELFLAGTFWFWALIALEIVLLFVFVEWENGVSATISLVVFGALLQFFGNVDIIGYVMGNPFQLIVIVAAYFVFGAVWGICKWWIFCRDRLEEYKELKSEFLRSKGLPENEKTIPIEHRVEWKKKLDDAKRYANSRNLGEAPLVRSHKAQILRWMSFWPISMIWGLINDFVRRVCKAIYNRISKFLQRVSDNIFSGVQDDLDLPEEDENEG